MGFSPQAVRTLCRVPHRRVSNQPLALPLNSHLRAFKNWLIAFSLGVKYLPIFEQTEAQDEPLPHSMRCRMTQTGYQKWGGPPIDLTGQFSVN
jgi:hypothetical protein